MYLFFLKRIAQRRKRKRKRKRVVELKKVRVYVRIFFIHYFVFVSFNIIWGWFSCLHFSQYFIEWAFLDLIELLHLKINVSDIETSVKQEMDGFCMMPLLITLKRILYEFFQDLKAVLSESSITNTNNN